LSQGWLICNFDEHERASSSHVVGLLAAVQGGCSAHPRATSNDPDAMVSRLLTAAMLEEALGEPLTEPG